MIIPGPITDSVSSESRSYVAVHGCQLCLAVVPHSFFNKSLFAIQGHRADQAIHSEAPFCRLQCRVQGGLRIGVFYLQIDNIRGGGVSFVTNITK